MDNEYSDKHGEKGGYYHQSCNIDWKWEWLLMCETVSTMKTGDECVW